MKRKYRILELRGCGKALQRAVDAHLDITVYFVRDCTFQNKALVASGANGNILIPVVSVLEI